MVSIWALTNTIRLRSAQVYPYTQALIAAQHMMVFISGRSPAMRCKTFVPFAGADCSTARGTVHANPLLRQAARERHPPSPDPCRMVSMLTQTVVAAMHVRKRG